MSKSMLRDITALLLAILATLLIFFGIPPLGIEGMLAAETLIVPDFQAPEETFAQVIRGVVKYCWSIGGGMLLVGAALILIGWEDRVVTDPDKES